MKYLSLAKIWTQKTYDWLSRYYDFLSGLSAEAKEGQQKVVEGLHTGSILDVACGTGALLALAHANGLECHGLDWSQGMLERARAKVPDAAFKRASFYQMPFPDGQFDYVVETNALGAVAIDVKRVLAEMVRVCRVGGEIRLADYAPPPQETWKSRLARQAGIILGDLPQDFAGMFREMGYEPQVEVLAGFGMYQFVRVGKTH